MAGGEYGRYGVLDWGLALDSWPSNSQTSNGDLFEKYETLGQFFELLYMSNDSTKVSNYAKMMLAILMTELKLELDTPEMSHPLTTLVCP